MHIGTVMANSFWIVGMGERIHFWMDNWLGEPLIYLLHIDVAFHGHIRGMVAEAIVNGALVMPSSITDFGDIKDRVEAIVLPKEQLADALVWPHNFDGNLTAKHAFSFLCTRAPLLPWADLIWSSFIPPSHSFIYWRFHHGRMPTDENLRSRGCNVVSICNLCLKNDETSEHLFLRCQFSKKLWDWIGGKLNRLIDCSTTDSLLSCIPASCSSQVSGIFVAAIVHTLHTIWWARNSLRFTTLTPSLHSAKVRIHSLVALSGNLSKGKCLQSDLAFLDAFAVSIHCRKVRYYYGYLEAPNRSVLKVNTDGSMVGGSTACGGLFRDHLGTFLGAFSCNAGIQSVYYAEVLGIILAIEFAAQQGWRNIWIESDSTSALMIFSNHSLVSMLLRNRWHNANILGLQVISSHIFREGICCADKLANLGHSMAGEIWLDTLPDEMKAGFFSG